MSSLLQTPLIAGLLVLFAKVTVLLAVAAAAQWLLGRRASAATRHGLWALMVVTLLLLLPLSLAGPEWPVAVTVADLPAPVAAAPDSQAQLNTAPPSLDAPSVSRMATGGKEVRSATPARVSWPAMAFFTYAAGVMVLLARLVTSQIFARRIVSTGEEIRDTEWRSLFDSCARALGVSTPVRLLRSPAQVMPMVIGLRKPAVLVSDDAETWSEDRRRAVMLHELAHVRRRDSLTQTLASLATALYWPHPGVWWAARRLQVEREFACDDCVLRAGAPADSYASDLLEIAYTLGGRRSPALAVTMARRGQLEGRLLAVLDAARNRATPGLASRVAASLAALAVLVPVAAIGITTRAASLPVGADAYTPPTLSERSPAGRAGQPSRGGTAPQPARLAKTLYSWSDVIEQSFSTSGTWSVQPSEKSGEVYFEMRQLHSSNGHTVPLSQLEGLTTAQMNAGGTVKFLLRRDAGTFTCEGVFREGVGGGAFTYAANPAFADELGKRGVTRPTAQQQFEMAKNDVSLALVDDLHAQGYQTPTSEDLVQAGHHGVSGRYVRDMGALGYKVGTIGALINMRDHGVSPDFVQGMLAEGLPKLSADDLVRARDHGVTPDYVRVLRSLGYGSLTLDALVKARDHGVSADYVTGMRDLGFKLPLDELVAARDHGVSTDYVRAMQGLGYKVSLDELVTARDHGVTPEYVRGLKDLGYSQLSIEELRTLRDHGATPERVKRANDKAGTKLSPEMLRTVMDGGMR
jgi:beta-lactamase regulating signal transducer with metallopeptidase domain